MTYISGVRPHTCGSGGLAAAGNIFLTLREWPIGSKYTE